MGKDNLGKVAVIMGGNSNEREISLQSGKAVLDALKVKGIDACEIDPMKDNLKKLSSFDRVFICLHGKDGEDGFIQKYLENIGVPYTGNKVEVSALCMDKYESKKRWKELKVLTPIFLRVRKKNDFEEASKICKLPFILKPSNSGSSLGVSIVNNKNEFILAFNTAYKIDRIVIAESFIKGREYTLPIIDNKPLPIIEIKTSNQFYDFEAKYLKKDTTFICPAELPEDLVNKINKKGIKAFKALGCEDWGRVDFIIDEKFNIFFIEINTIPGMTSHSLVPMSAKEAGINFDDLVIKILEKASV